jgi:hypothetical protein
MLVAGVHLQLAQHRVAERAFGQHAFHGLGEHALGLGRVRFRERLRLQAARKAGVVVVHLALGLAAGDPDLRRVDHDDEIAGVHVRRVFGLMLAAQARGDLDREATQHLVLSVDDDPAVLDLARFCRESCHVAKCLWMRGKGANSIGKRSKKKRGLVSRARNPPFGGGWRRRGHYATLFAALQPRILN